MNCSLKINICCATFLRERDTHTQKINEKILIYWKAKDLKNSKKGFEIHTDRYREREREREREKSKDFGKTKNSFSYTLIEREKEK